MFASSIVHFTRLIGFCVGCSLSALLPFRLSALTTPPCRSRLITAAHRDDWPRQPRRGVEGHFITDDRLPRLAASARCPSNPRDTTSRGHKKRHSKSWLDNRHERHCPAWHRRFSRSCRCQHSCVGQKNSLRHLPNIVSFIVDLFFCMPRDRKDFRGAEKSQTTIRHPTKGQKTTHTAG